MITRNVFVSHSWKHDRHYENMIGILRDRGYFDFRDYSVPSSKPIQGANSDRALREAIRTKMQPCGTILIVAGEFANTSRWMNEEIGLAQRGFGRPKPIIAVEPRGSVRSSAWVKEQATEVVRWNADSIMNAIRRHSP